MTTLDPNYRPAPPWLVWLSVVLGLVVTLERCVGLAPRGEQVQGAAMRTLPASLLSILFFSACADDAPEPFEPQEIGEGCIYTASTNEFGRCADGLVCNTSHGLTNDRGYCAAACRGDDECPAGSFCDAGACGWRCAESNNCADVQDVVVGLHCWQETCVCSGCL